MSKYTKSVLVHYVLRVQSILKKPLWECDFVFSVLFSSFINTSLMSLKCLCMPYCSQQNRTRSFQAIQHKCVNIVASILEDEPRQSHLVDFWLWWQRCWSLPALFHGGSTPQKQLDQRGISWKWIDCVWYHHPLSLSAVGLSVEPWNLWYLSLVSIWVMIWPRKSWNRLITWYHSMVMWAKCAVLYVHDPCATLLPSSHDEHS